MRRLLFSLGFLFGVVLPLVAQQPAPASAASASGMPGQSAPNTNPDKPNPFLTLMQRAVVHAKQHHALTPLLSPIDRTVAPAAFAANAETAARRLTSETVPVEALHSIGVRIVPWTTNDPEQMRAVIRTGVDGLISDRPDLLQRVVAEERAANPNDPRWKTFVVSAHRGGRGLRPENTLPSFESGLDQLATELETDTGVSTDGVSLIWHDQFYNPQSCRHADGSPYTLANRTYLRDVSVAQAQQTFICDKLHGSAFPDQRNDLTLSPVSVAFSAKEHRPHPYAPTYAAELFRFVRFYVDFYSTGAGKNTPDAAERAANARTVRFNIETKLFPNDLPPDVKRMQEPGVPLELIQNHTRDPQAFVDALAGTIHREGMEDRCDIQSFDFRTLLLVAEQYPQIPTVYLTQSPTLLRTAFVPATLRPE
ncbi:glycerophosphodiester phosphodiesterase family protein [Terriglobus sp.]|uniref:glycerophosphodiester phosphodiesterase family protein n=1 Tax=Terriglobus sp. TaxID=1889013 RepID=UPI003AFF9071